MSAAKPDSIRIVRTVGVSAFAIVLILAVAAISLANIAATRAPALVLKWYPFHSRALAEHSASILTRAAGARDIANAKAYAQESLRRSPLSVPAVRTLALVANATGDDERERALMQYSLAASRRDFLTQAWFIESKVVAGDVRGALIHYDMALKTSKAAHAVLLPIMVQAVADDRIIMPLADILKTNPVWARPFVIQLVNSDVPIGQVAKLAILLRAHDVFDQPREEQLVSKLIEHAQYDTAAVVANAQNLSRSSFTGSFNRSSPKGPFSWKFKSDYEMGAAIQGGKQGTLHVYAAHEQGGEVARILLRLKNGRYRLVTQGDNLPESLRDQPYWQLECASGKAGRLATLNVGELSTILSVPARCDAQWLTLQVRAPEAPDGIQFSIRTVAIEPA